MSKDLGLMGKEPNGKDASKVGDASRQSQSVSPLDMNCEDAISYVLDHIQARNLAGVGMSQLSSLSNFAFLEKLSEMMLIPTLTECIGIAFHPILPDLVGRWGSLGNERTAEIVCALGRLVYYEPNLKRYAQELMLPRPSMLKGIEHLAPGMQTADLLTQFQAIQVDNLRECLLAAFRLVLFSPSVFPQSLPPNPLLALLQHPDLSIRFLAIQLLAISLGFADAAKAQWLNHYVGDAESRVMAPWEGFTIDYGVLGLMESERIRAGKQKIREREYFRERTGIKLLPSDLGEWTGEICGVLVPRFSDAPGPKSNLVMTESTKINLRNIAATIVAEKPLLLQSVPGAGKSFLIDEAAKLFGRYDDIVRIALTDQTDAKLLLGTYVTTTPGSFTWRSGILTTAVREGKWIVIEDIERAGNDVLSVLLPVLEGRPLKLNGREDVEMGKGGQIIATTRLLSGPKSGMIENMLGIRRWIRVTVVPSSDDELLEIITHRLPRLGFIAPVLLRVYTSLREMYNNPALKISRNLSPRDLLKWTKRTSVLCSSVTGESIPRETWEDIFHEAVDCFAAMIPSIPSRRAIIGLIGSEMGFPSEHVNHFLEAYSPNLTDGSHAIQIGRITAPKKSGSSKRAARPFAYTNHARKLMEQLAVAVVHREPLLLVGETGTGKTTIVQHLADTLHHHLLVVNVSQQTESSDLLGGFKPVDPRTLAVQLKEAFDSLFQQTFSVRRNEAFLARVMKNYSVQKWPQFIKLLNEAIGKAEVSFETPPSDDGGMKKKRRVDNDLKDQWRKFADSVRSFDLQLQAGKGKAHAFSFVEGSLVKALRRGDWLLLDEINLAASDTLESIARLIREGGSITLPEKGDIEAIKPHPNFRIFACMNPATDVGKRDLPPSLRSQFTELYVGSPDESMADLLLIIKRYIGHLCVGDEKAVSDVAHLYLKIKAAADEYKIVDGVGQKPHFSIRTLTRTLSYVMDTANMYGLRRALYEGFCMSFSTMLEEGSRRNIVQVISDGIYPGANRNLRSVLRSLPKRPEGEYIQLGHYWIERGPYSSVEDPLYIVKPDTSVERNLHNLVRATLTRRYPILLQGPTSSGKTSMIEYLAKLTGHKFVRINNHEHTSLDEYLGTYVSTPTGDFVFQGGILVQALRQGHWIVLDELNLAPSDVLEALNRLLDDNRELLIPETQEVIIPHPHFMVFATQNPAGLYGGRKVLSRAFRNRFLELEFDDIPEHELEEILCLRCQIPPSYGAKIVEVYKQLSLQRQSTRLFEQRNSFATLRDLFRWAQRQAVGYQQLAEHGYMLLAERVRRDQERLVVKQAIEKVMKVKIDEEVLYDRSKLDPRWTAGLTNTDDMLTQAFPKFTTNSSVIWTKAMRRLFILVSQALVNNEPVLLVGETGTGKTTVCQILAEQMGKKLHIINVHQNTETADIIGGQRPYRDRLRYQTQLVSELRAFLSDRHEASYMSLERLLEEFSKLNVDEFLASSENPDGMLTKIENIRDNFNRHKILFEWVDGALVQAMKQGEPFLLDEISLADDSVLERLNSVLEPSRSIVLAEKGSDDVHVAAAEGFQFFATMNPGGDYGKKELSPALRNRFTEIWVPAVEDHDDLVQIVKTRLTSGVKQGELIVNFAEWFTRKNGYTGATISIRDILAWVQMVNATHSFLGPELSLFHGAMMVYIDGIGSRSGTEFLNLHKEKTMCVAHLSALLEQDFSAENALPIKATSTDTSFALGHFGILKGKDCRQQLGFEAFSFEPPTTAANGMKVLRAMQLPKAILLEGAPGVGKTSLIAAIASGANRHLTRINLSDQTDLMDLFGSDVPVEGGRGGEFAWKDAPFLRSMQRGDWVLLDELNLASQSVLEGLNACLDHRGTAYIPELNRSFERHPDFRMFAAQNPHAQGGGRKGLPKSFLNRFSVVHVDSLNRDDMYAICSRLYPSMDDGMLKKFIDFVARLQAEVEANHVFGSVGKPWEFNLRDLQRWLQLAGAQSKQERGLTPADYMHLVIGQRLRTPNDRKHVEDLYTRQVGPLRKLPSTYSFGLYSLHLGITEISRREAHTRFKGTAPKVTNDGLQVLENIALCIDERWPCLLVGPSGSGKTALIRSMAAVVGAPLEEISMNNDTDATDIIGGYEQRDLTRRISCLCEEIRCRGVELLASTYQPNRQALLGEILFYVSNSIRLNYNILSLRSRLHEFDRMISGNEMSDFRRLISSLCESIGELIQDDDYGKFQWYDGILVDAVTKGGWIVLNNANLCNPSILDRLNSMLEFHGSLVIHESTNADGEPRTIRPHPDFRLFLTIDPCHGELSRAMRNRYVYLGMESNLRFVQDVAALLVGNKTSESAAYHVKFVGQILEYAPIQTIPYLQRWLESNVDVGRAHLIGFREILKELMTLPTVKDTIAFMENALSNSFRRSSIDSQCFLPVLNDFLLFEPTLRKFDWKRFSTTYDLCIHLVNMRMFLKEIQDNASRRERDEKRPLVLALRNSPRNSIGLLLQPAISSVVLLQKIADELTNWIMAKSYSRASDEDIEKLENLLRLWFDMASLLNDRHLDPSYYSIFRDSLKEWIQQSKDRQLTGFVTAAHTALDGLSKSLTLSTGIGLPLIWEAARPTLPSTQEQWDCYEELVTLLDQFDSQVAFQTENLEDILAIKTSFMASIDDLLQAKQPIQFPLQVASFVNAFLIQSFRSGTQYLNTRPNLIVKEGIFAGGFRSLIELTKLNSAGLEGDDESKHDLVALCHLAGQHTRRLLYSSVHGDKMIITSLVQPFPQKDLFRQLSGLELVKQCIFIAWATRGSFLINSNGFSKPRNRDFEDNHIAMKLFTRLFAKIGNMTSPPCSSLLASLRSEIREILKIYTESNRDEPLNRDLCSFILDFLEATVEVNNEIWKSKEMKVAFQYPLRQLYAAISASFCCEQSEFDHGRLRPLAEAYIRFGLACISLFVPDKPFDPAAVMIANSKRASLHEADLSETVLTRTYIEQHLRGSSKSCRLDFDLFKLEEAKKASAKSRHLNVYRPRTSQVSQMQQNFDQLLDITVKSARLEAYLASPDSNRRELETAVSTLERLANRLEEHYPYYRDVLSFVIAGINRLVFGLHLLLDVSSTFTNADKHLLPTSNVLSIAQVTNPIAVETWFQMQLVIGARNEGMSLFYLYSLQRAGIAALINGIPFQIDGISAILDQCYMQWRIRKEMKKAEGIAKSSIYKRKDEDYELEQAIAELFPDQLLESYDEGTNAQQGEQEITMCVFELHRKLFDFSRKLTAVDDIRGVLQRGLRLVSHYPAAFLTSDLLSLSFPAQIFTLASVQNLFSDVDTLNYDFYRSSNFAEIRTLTAIVSAIQKDALSYIQAWPEHVDLRDIVGICDKILDLPTCAPLSYVIPYTERLYSLLDQWQGVASRDYSLAGGQEKVKETIIGWRRLELATWRSLLAAEEQRHRETVSSWWFDIYELIIFNQRSTGDGRSPEDLAKIVASLNDFITTSTLGDYQDRLQLLFRFSIHAHLESRNHPALTYISQACHHLYRLYGLYLSDVQKSLADQKATLEKEIAETVQLASWRDTSVFALTESAKRSHHRLYKTIRKYRGLLSQPVAPILQVTKTVDLKMAANMRTYPFLARPSDANLNTVYLSIRFCRDRHVWSANSRLFLEPFKLASSIQNIFDRCTVLNSGLPISAHEFVVTIEELRKQTPATLTDENEKQVRFLTTQKRRVFAQSMKSLREWGITSKNVDHHSASADAHRVVMNPVWKHHPEESMQGQIDETFYQIIDLLPRLRVTATEHSPELSDAEFRRAHGYLEGLVDGLFDQRQVIIEFEESVLRLKKMFSQTLSMLSSQMHSADIIEHVLSPSARSYVESRSDLLRRLSAVLATCVSILEAHKSLDAGMDISAALNQLHELQKDCSIWLDRISHVSYNDNIVFSDAIRCCEGIDDWLNKIGLDIADALVEHPKFTYIFTQVSEILEYIDGFVELSPTQTSIDPSDVSLFQQQAESLGASVLNVVQAISKLIESSDFITPLNYRRAKSIFKSLIKQLHPLTVENMISIVFETSIPLLSSQLGLQHVLAVVNSLMPVLQCYIYGCEQVQHHMTLYHKDYSQMTFVLMIAFHTLATKGYCSPQRSDKEAGEAQADGVGLGEGQGETDISNDIGDDEDLNDIAQQRDTEAAESKAGDDQNGVDMEDDFDGALEDVSGDEEEQADDEEGEEMDEGIGGIDADPSAVDEQFWEDQANSPQPPSGDETQTQGQKKLEDQKGELGANSREQLPKEGTESKKEEDELAPDEGDYDEFDESGVQNKEEDTAMPEAQPLDLPDDLELNQPDGEGKAESVLSDKMDLDSVEEGNEQTEEIDSGSDVEKPDEQEMDVDGEGEVTEDNDMHEESNVNTQTIDQSKYEGDDIAASDAIGKGGDSITAENLQGSQGDDTQQEKNSSHDPACSKPEEGADGPGESRMESDIPYQEASGEQGQPEPKSDSSLRKLGDVLKQWRRDLQKIYDVAAEESQQEKTVGEQNPEFSYVGEEQQSDSQALGPAAREEAQPLDMTMAVDEGPTSPPKHVNPSKSESDEPHVQGTDIDYTSHTTSFGARIGEYSAVPDQMDVGQLQTSRSDEPLTAEAYTSDMLTIQSICNDISDSARQTWSEHDRSIHDLSLSLCEQLRLILEPTQATKLRGDFRTGKRLNMRRIIPYIASGYKKDKIWMRRTKPSKRQYQVMLAVDDSKSMSDSKSVGLAFDTLALTAKALSQLEVGQIAIVRFGEDVRVVHSFEEQFTSESGARVVEQFKFDQSRTDVLSLTKTSIELFSVARAQQDVRSIMGGELWQLELIISDGICEDHDTISRLVREAFESKIMMIFVILDAIHSERKGSILDIKSYSFDDGELMETRYLDSFPFNYFVIVRDVRELPSVLASALRQWFAEVAER